MGEPLRIRSGLNSKAEILRLVGVSGILNSNARLHTGVSIPAESILVTSIPADWFVRATSR